MEAAVHRVVLEEVGEVVGGDQVVDRDDLDRRVVGREAVDEAADAAETIDADADGHGERSFQSKLLR